MLSWSLLLGILCAAAFVWFWQNSLSAREHANRAAKDACARMQLQFLDGTVAFARLRLARNDRGQLSLRRTYVFDYTATSIERRQGFVVLLGTRVESIGFEPDRMPAHMHKHAEPEDDDPQSSNVLDLEEWRQRRRNQPRLPGDRPNSNTGNSTGNKPSDNGW